MHKQIHKQIQILKPKITEPNEKANALFYIAVFKNDQNELIKN